MVARLQILATTDLHMRLLPFDYILDQPSQTGDLATLATLVERLRSDNPNTLLFDNGDFLQGTPMADIAAEAILQGIQLPHPAIEAMNAIGYDTAGIGNHEFDYGLPVLHAALATALFPILSANLRIRRDKARPRLKIQGEAILERSIRTTDGKDVSIRIGVFGLTPVPTVDDTGRDATPAVTASDMSRAARRASQKLRALGADLVIALCHAGFGAAGAPRTNTIAPIIGIKGVDVVIGGHTHRPFPGPQPATLLPELDALAGRFAETPVVIPGPFGAHLGRINLNLSREDGKGWQVQSSNVDLVSPEPCERIAHPAIVERLEMAHTATRAACDEIVGMARAPIQSILPLVLPDQSLALLADAQANAIAARLAGSPWTDLPILSAVAPRQNGSISASDAPIAIPKGPIRRKHLFQLSPFPDRCCAIVVSGGQIRQWLTQAATVFLPISQGSRLQQLFDPDRPAYTFDVIHGLTYRIELCPGAPRIRDIRHDGIEVSDDDNFVVALSSHRLEGGGGYGMLRDCPVVCDGEVTLADALRRHLAAGPVGQRFGEVWSFAPLPDTAAQFDVDARILPFLVDQPHLRKIGQDNRTRQRLEIDLSDRSRLLAPAAG